MLYSDATKVLRIRVNCCAHACRTWEVKGHNEHWRDMGKLLSLLFGRREEQELPVVNDPDTEAEDLEAEAEPNGDVESRDTEDDDESTSNPLGHREYEFSASQSQRDVGPAPELNQSYLSQTQAYLHAIDQEYDRVFALRRDIDNLLKGFKQKLHVDETTELKVCFEDLRKLVGDYETLKLSRDEQLRIIVGEDADDDAKDAIEKFNIMLERCCEFPEQQHAAETTIQEKIMATENESMQFHATQEALQRAKKQLNTLPKWGKEIQSLINDTTSASKHLRQKITTGIIRNIQLDN